VEWPPLYGARWNTPVDDGRYIVHVSNFTPGSECNNPPYLYHCCCSSCGWELSARRAVVLHAPAVGGGEEDDDAPEQGAEQQQLALLAPGGDGWGHHSWRVGAQDVTVDNAIHNV
jgi:hypothetical protein